MPRKKAKASAQEPPKSEAAQDPAAFPTFLICRNKHWRHISSYHGPWLNAPLDELERCAYVNYNAVRPRPIVPSVFFDVLKIRRFIDDATTLSVRAANGTAASSLLVSSSRGADAEALGLGPTRVGNAKLSRERRHRMREHATQKLAQAYRLDEIASSVAVMQGASALEDVAKHVLQRNEDDPDAQYVHFFHEKIPSMAFVEHTSLAPLDDILRHLPTEASTYRTRAVAQLFMNHSESAIRDCTDGLSVLRLYHSHRLEKQRESAPGEDTAKPGRGPGSCDRLEEEDQPSSLELQLLFLRGYASLTLACDNAMWAFYDGDEDDEEAFRKDAKAAAEAEQQAVDIREEARKLVRPHAKMALRDYMSFLSHLDYTPGLTPSDFDAFVEGLEAADIGDTRQARRKKILEACARYGSGVFGGPGRPHKDRQKDWSLPKLPQPPVYTLNTLFTAVPPAGVPSFPPEASKEHGDDDPSTPNFTEVVTYHPLLSDVLHSLLLCHCLLQTSAKELARHAYMVARITRISDGYPLFLSARSPARADWAEILRQSKDWLRLSDTWDNLCTPVTATGPHPSAGSTGNNSFPKGPNPQAPKDFGRKDVAAMEIEQVLSVENADDKPVAHGYEDVQEEECGGGKAAGNNATNEPGADDGQVGWQIPRQEEGKENPFIPVRAETIVRWILNAPPPRASDGGTRPKKKSGAKRKPKKKKNAGPGLEGCMGSLELVN
ncbi:hypothetical protein PV08_08407 [Exophiala spinifera]|uniref:Uncharacterized protein n=1 Tax=Exophiala spinifera TaxID=91928 RepID=A0A0D2B3I7_9EURO|nr:uncharacterized protein PV08_08407 [Exophiala spinifera]KIW13220.1 hypothetical protein PV08_08407 [Exophiala spinifera]